MRSVRRTVELDRIRLLPRRDWERDYNVPAVVEYMTRALARPDGEMELLPVQAVALAELYDYGGLMAPIEVGGGKTLVSLLAPVVVKAKRPVLLVPAAHVKGKVQKEAQEYAKHWVLPPISIQSYETLSRDWDNAWLEQKMPDLVVCDESHKLKNTKAACWKKLARHVRKYRRKGHDIRVVLLSGTAFTRHLREIWHLLRLALGDSAPVPNKWEDMNEWALALDTKVPPGMRLLPGPLVELGRHEGGARTSQAQQAFQDRLLSTPGVVALKGARPECGLEIYPHFIDLPPHLEEHFQTLRETWETPDGHPFEYVFDLWRHARELACGFYGVWDPRPPDPWLRARLVWHRFVRDTLARSRTLDSAAQVLLAVQQGRLDDSGAWSNWQKVQDTFKPNPVPVWVDDTVLKHAADWLTREQGICWVEHRAFGQKLAALTGFPHFRDYGLDSKGRSIEDVSGPAIAQIKPCSEGLNLQKRHHKNLTVSCEPTGSRYEQLIGRTHRQGQVQDTVTVEHVFACAEQLEGFWQAVRDSEPSKHKLSYATNLVPELSKAPVQGYAWKRKVKT